VPRADQDPAAVVRETYDVWNEHGLDAVAERYWHPEIELVVPPEWAALLGQERAAGRDDVVAVYKSATAAIEDSQAEIIDLDPAGDEFVVTMRFRGRGQTSGVDVESLRLFQVLRIEDGMVRRIRFFNDAEAARAAAGADGS
jgi:ketosteroid isomerase-like protein